MISLVCVNEINIISCRMIKRQTSGVREDDGLKIRISTCPAEKAEVRHYQ